MDKFKILKTLGKGSFGIVYKVIRKEDNKVYALKQVTATKDNLNEVRLLASLEHPNIIKFLEAFPFKNRGDRVTKISIIMEYATRGDLSKVIKRHVASKVPLREKRIWKYISQISSALSFLHKHGILHRDLKPANCFLGKNDTIKLGDMNISKVMKYNKFARTKIGTPYYMSPEVWNNIPYNEKCDVWSVGCMSYELAALKVPFTGYSAVELLRKINLGHRVKVPNKYYSPQLWNIINKMLEKKPSNRISINDVYNLTYDRNKNNLKCEIKQINMLGTIMMTPKIQILTDRMPKSRYNKYRKSPIQSNLNDIKENPSIPNGNIAKLRSDARLHYKKQHYNKDQYNKLNQNKNHYHNQYYNKHPYQYYQNKYQYHQNKYQYHKNKYQYHQNKYNQNPYHQNPYNKNPYDKNQYYQYPYYGPPNDKYQNKNTNIK
tara:strand:+ start:589 stop:1887 length:1299 start_codon:yes stop_codon:yes gene_type:complete